ncbi:cactin-like isoform X3 [Homarus americanus]|uniref:cactin-like isoform X3 n=1 Tax=Homarus americanus TaxID=6706 RepID=UPI001C475E9A|nr:cactin-like isoform X3 [Homarus americanus]
MRDRGRVVSVHRLRRKVRSNHKKNMSRDTSPSRSKELKKTNKRRSVLRSSSEESQQARHSRSRSSSRHRERCDHKKSHRSRSRDRGRHKSRSRDRQKSRSRDRDRQKSRSRDRDRQKSRSRDRDRQRSRSRDKDRQRSRSRDRDRQRSRSRDRDRQRSRSRDKDRQRSRSRDRDRQRSRSRDRDRQRSRSKDRDRQKSRSRDRQKSRSRDRQKSRSRDRQKSHSRDRQKSRSRDRDRDRHKSRSRDRQMSHSQDRERKWSKSLESGRPKQQSRSRDIDSFNHNRNSHRSRSSSEESTSKSSLSKTSSKYKTNTEKDPTRLRKPMTSLTGSSDESSEDDTKLLLRLHDERKKVKEDKVKQKKAKKLMETPAEKRLRRLQKKEAKERKRKEKMGWDSEYLHFTNADNPYGDNNLLDTFVWKKKLEKEGLTDISREDIEKQNRAKMDENRMELEKVKKRRQERELERLEREKMMELEQRQREAAQFSQFSKQEDQFQLEQARLRSYIRIQDGRAKPIDLLAQYVSSEGDVSAVDMHEPYTHLTGLTLMDLEDLLEDIKVYMQLEKEGLNQTYWTDLTIIVQDELRRLRQRDTIEDATTHRQGIHAAVAADVSSVFQNKSLSELNKLQLNIESKLSGPTTGLDIGYWESLLSQLKAHQARARLRERHRDNLRKKLEMLKAEQGVKEEEERHGENVELKVEVETESSEESTDESRPGKEEDEDGEEKQEEVVEDDKKDKSGDEVEENVTERWDLECEGDAAIATSISAYVAGRYSPRLVSGNKLEPGTVIVDEREDEQRLAWARQRVVGAGQPVESVLSAEEKVMQREAQRAMANDEAQFSVEAKLDTQHFLWSDKYRPRKPRYFNRVHTGFEWNKYNQTHYDMDNPPPKIVQGYKFNIFYPDLIDKSKTPQYELIPCDDNKDFAILKFTAGPPYEAIAFKIVNREWEYSYKRGFRCQFHNNIFQLWFHFKRYRYRR